MGEHPNGQRRGGRRAPSGPPVGRVLAATVVGQARKGIMVDVGGVDLLLPRSRWGAAADRLDAVGYGDAVSVEVVAGGGADRLVGLSRIAIERSIRQPRSIEGLLRVAGATCTLEPVDGAEPFAVHLLDVADPSGYHGRTGPWPVGAPLLGVRVVVTDVDGGHLA